MNVGFIGKLGSGKSSASRFLVNEYGYEQRSFADPIRYIVREIFCIKDKTDPRCRPLMQKIGTDWFRSEEPDVWVNYLINHTRDTNSPITVDDIRFINEASCLLEEGWLLIYLDCPEEIRKRRCLERDGNFDEKILNHPSETGVDDIIKQYRSSIYVVDAGAPLPNMLDGIANLLKTHHISPRGKAS